ncbi:MAG: cytochrome c3 family protein [Desulfamplus sp.]|nr:cytochrome c3 family protein [Desulfamplus sp.]
MNKFIYSTIMPSIAIAIISIALISALISVSIPAKSYANDCFTINGETIDANTNTRPFVCFQHDTHNEKAGVENCDRCHHLYDEQGKRLEGQTSEGQSCSECHAGNSSSNNGSSAGLENSRKLNIDLAVKYHKLCRDCHLAEKKGPVVCGGCHKK